MEIISAEKLKRLMIERGLSCSGLATKAEIQPRLIARFLKGNRPAQLPTVGKLSKALQVDFKAIVA